MSIPEVIATLNRMEIDGVIERYAIGGAVGATFYLEPVATLDVYVFVARPTVSRIICLSILLETPARFGHGNRFVDHDLTEDEQRQYRADDSDHCAHEPARRTSRADNARKKNEEAASERARDGINGRSVFASLQILPGNESPNGANNYDNQV